MPFAVRLLCRHAVGDAGMIGVMTISSPGPACGEIPYAVLEAFGVEPGSVSRSVGEARVYDGVVLKPVTHTDEAEWCANVFEALEVPDLRLPRPLRAHNGAAVVMGWCGWEHVAGQPAPERWLDVLAVADRLHRSLAGYARPGWMGTKDDPWRQADRYAWDEAALATHLLTHRLHPLLQPLEKLRTPDPPRSQVVHLDLLGNVLFTGGAAAPAIIDPTFYWRPAGYSAAIVAVDAAAWTAAGVAPLEHVADGDDLHLVVRAARFRIARDVLNPAAGADEFTAHAKVVDWILEHVAHG